MSDREKPLPKPPSAPFGRKKRAGESEEGAPLMADRIAMAAAEGKLEEFMESGIPDSEYARKLVSMMMGMTGMSAADSPQPGEEKQPHPPEDRSPSSSEPPEEVLEAVRSGDVKGLAGLLAREHRKRVSDGEECIESPEAKKAAPSIEKETIDALISIAAENDVSPDWLVLRAIRLYVGEYRKTGRL